MHALYSKEVAKWRNQTERGQYARIMRIIGKRVKTRREKKGFKNVNQLAMAAGELRTTIARLEDGQGVDTSVHTLGKVSAALGCEISDLVKRSDYRDSVRE